MAFAPVVEVALSPIITLSGFVFHFQEGSRDLNLKRFVLRGNNISLLSQVYKLMANHTEGKN
jgi:hypothetical protein